MTIDNDIEGTHAKPDCPAIRDALVAHPQVLQFERTPRGKYIPARPVGFPTGLSSQFPGQPAGIGTGLDSDDE